ncbi:MAG: DUF6036 family nucleotidyltransferase [Bacteroidota bacterium]
MDKTAFRIKTFKEAEDHTSYWQSKSVEERLSAATELTRRAFNLSADDFGKIDKAYFAIRWQGMNNIFNRDFQHLVKLLNSYNVRYILVGGYSVILHGYSRSTGDIDIWVEPSSENYKKLVQAFTAFGMPVFDMVESKFLNTYRFDVFTFGREPNQVEILTKVKGLKFEEAFTNSIWFEFSDMKVRSLNLSDLKKAKAAAGRLRDQVDLEQLGLIDDE